VIEGPGEDRGSETVQLARRHHDDSMQSGTVTGMAGTGGVLRIGDTEVRLRMPRKDTGALPRERIQVDAELVDLDDSGDDEAPPSLTAGEADDESTEDGYLSIFPHLEELGEAAVNTYRQSLCLDVSSRSHWSTCSSCRCGRALRSRV
jgi:hypothetical protein